MTTAAQHRRHWPRYLLAAAVLAGIAVWRDHQQQQRAEAVAHATQQKGGQVFSDTTLVEKVHRWCAGYPVNWKAGRMVTLFDAKLDSAWLQEHDDLADLQIAYLHLGRSTVSTNDALRLIARQPLQNYSARGQRDADTVAAALAGKSRLTVVELAETDLTDAGLRRLPLEQLEALFIEGTLVTTSGLSELRRCRVLTNVSIDAHQFDETVVSILAELPALERVSLVGPGIRDENIMLITGLKKLPYLHLVGTSVTDVGAEKLSDAMPATVIGRE